MYITSFLHSQFHTKDLGTLNYFLGVEVIRNKQGILLSQQKNVLNKLFEIVKLGAKPCSTPVAPNVQLTKEGNLFKDPEQQTPEVGPCKLLLEYFHVERHS